MKRKRKLGCLGIIVIVVIVMTLLAFGGSFLLSIILKEEAKKEGILTETVENQADTERRQDAPETGWEEEPETAWEEEPETETEETQPETAPEQEGIPEEELSGKFYYEKLSPEEQAAYRVIAAGMRERQDEIRVDYPDGKRASELFQQILLDFPEIFWCSGATEYITYPEPDSYVIINPDYLYDREETEQKKAEVEAVAQECLAGISEDAGDYDKILYVFEYLVNTVDYDMTVDNNQYIYSALVDKRSVCAGYSRATQYLLERLGVFCTYVTGTAQSPLTGNDGHAWNLVLCDGDYYYVDTTWGDPVFTGEEEDGRENNISYDYLCCNDEELFKTHTPDPSLELPKCTKMDANYYVVNGMYYTEYDSESIFDVMLADIREGKEQSVFKFADSNIYGQAHEDIFGNLMERAMQEVIKQYQLQQGFYRYVDDDRLNKITIYWEYE